MEYVVAALDSRKILAARLAHNSTTAAEIRKLRAARAEKEGSAAELLRVMVYVELGNASEEAKSELRALA